MRILILTAIALCSTLAASAEADEQSAQIAFFEAKIRPVLISHCYKCHSAGAGNEVKGSLLLDTATGLLAGGDSGSAVVAGQPDSSLLIQALRYDGLEMPPAGKLPDQVIRDFEKWVSGGAVDPRIDTPEASPSSRSIDVERGRQFWAFRTFTDHESAAESQNAATSSLDRFVAKKLAENGLSPVDSADAKTLIRRLYFDLTGLPPTRDELTGALVNVDSSRPEFEALVNRLLDSPQFGVHWGRHWLDVARYADSNGGDFNATFHNAWKYRDYVVESMNADMPFDQFVREQIAGDLLPFETDEQRARQLIATGFLMVGTKMLSERDKDKLTMDVVDEQVSTVGSAFLGMTLGCARCHDHKFDPIPTRDYYALAGIFRSTRTLEGESQKYVSTWRRTSLPASNEHIATVKTYKAKEKDLESRLKAAKSALADLQKSSSTDDRFVVDDVAATVIGEWRSSKLTPRFVGIGYIHDDQKNKGEKSVEFSWQPVNSGTYEVRLSYTPSGNRANNVPIGIVHADGEANVTVDQTKAPQFDEKFSPVGRFRFDSQTMATVTVSTAGTKGYVIVDAVQFVEVDESGKVVPPKADSDHATRLNQQQEAVTAVENELKELKTNEPAPLPEAIAVADLPKADDCEICIRGEHRNLGEKVPRGFLQVASLTSPSLANAASGRFELADWIASPENPLTARVIVNRVWSHLLGEGIVRSVDNFGELGQRPSHPELLDHLATRFATPQGEETNAGNSGFGWSIKSLVREIVLSNTYQRSTRHDETTWQADPENRLLWRAHRRRVPAESLRDAVLLISGKLDLSAGGSPVDGLGTLVKSNSADAEDYQQESTSRRSLYLPIIRNELPPILTAFDFADPDLVVGKRPVTNVPAQALFLMNSPFVMDNAEASAERLCGNDSQSVEDVIVDTYEAVLARRPAAVEVTRAAEFLNVKDRAVQWSQATVESSEPFVTRLTRFVHVLFASTEFRMLE